MSQTLQDILNTIQWEDYELNPDNLASDSQFSLNDFAESGGDEHAGRKRGLDSRRELISSAPYSPSSLPSTAFSTNSYFDVIDDEYERAKSEFDRIAASDTRLFSDDDENETDDESDDNETEDNETEDNEADDNKTDNNEGFSDDEYSRKDIPTEGEDSSPLGVSSLNQKINSGSDPKQGKSSKRSSFRDDLKEKRKRRKKHHIDDLDSVALSNEQLFHLHLDDGDIDAFRDSIQHLKEEIMQIDFEKKKQELESLKKELQEIETMNNQEPLSESTSPTLNLHPTVYPDSSLESPSNTDASLENPPNVPDTLSEDELIRIKEMHYATLRSQLVDDENPIVELLRSVSSLSSLIDPSLGTSKSVGSSLATSLESTLNATKVDLSATSLNLSLKESTILSDMKQKEREQKEMLRKQRREHRERIEKLRKEREALEERARQEEQERQERERKREEEYQREKEERERQMAIWIMQREEQLMRDYMFEQEQIRLEEEQKRKKLEEEKRREWEAEQQRIREEEIRKAEERRQRIEQEKRERERILRERHERELALKLEKEEEERRRLEMLEKQRLEMEKKRKIQQRNEYHRRIKLERQQCRRSIMQSVSIIRKRFSTLLPKRESQTNKFQQIIVDWKRSVSSKRKIKPQLRLTRPPTPEIDMNGDIVLDDELIEVLSGDTEIEQSNMNQLVNLILSVENIFSIGSITRPEHRNVKSLVMDENELQTLDNMWQFSMLRHLSVRLNQLKTIEGVSKLTDLLEFNLATNRLKSLYGVEGCSNLKLLDASHNSLTSIAHVAPCKNLAVLKLYRNQLDTLTHVSYLENLLELDAGRNALVSIDQQTFEYCPLLQKLILYENRIEGLPALNNVLLRQIFLNGNCVDNASTNSFLPMLEYLNMSDNRIMKLPSFRYYFMLRNVNISFNNITSIEEMVHAFRNSSIEVLKANDNPVCLLNGYREVMIATMPRLRVLDDDTVSDSERNDIEYYCTIRGRRNLHRFWSFLELLKYNSPFSLMRMICDENTNWYTLFRDAETLDRDHALDEEVVAYRRMCFEQSSEYSHFNSFYKKKLYIPLDRKTDQNIHSETLRLKTEYYERWHSLSQRHYQGHSKFEKDKHATTIVFNPSFAQSEAASTIQTAYRRYRLKKRSTAAIKIQSFIRGSLCRTRTVPWMLKQIRMRHRAAIRIQKLWRGYRVRYVLWKAKQVDPWLDDAFGDFEQVDISEFNYNPATLGQYELKAELPPERKVNPSVVPVRRPSVVMERQDSLKVLNANRSSPDVVSTSSEDNAQPSVYQNTFHSSYMKQRVNTLSRVERPGSSSKPHTMDLLDAKKSPSVSHAFGGDAKNQLRSSWNNNGAPSDLAKSAPTVKPHRAPTLEDRIHDLSDRRSSYGPHDEFEDESEPQYMESFSPHVSDSGKKRSALQKEKEEWQFKNENTANAWEKWAKKRKKLKNNALKAKNSDPITRLKAIQKKSQNTTVATTKRSEEKLFSQRNSISVRSSYNTIVDPLEVESVSSQDFAPTRTTTTTNTTSLRAPVRTNTLQFPSSMTQRRK